MFVTPHRAAAVYRQVQVEQASPVQLVVMLYDRAILHLHNAQGHARARRMAAKGAAIGAAVDIIAELQAVLDVKRGGDIARKLNALYTYMLERLTEANYRNDPAGMDEVARLLAELREGWRGLAEPAAAAARGAR